MERVLRIRAHPLDKDDGAEGEERGRVGRGEKESRKDEKAV
jgi:hypothetical protein